MKYLVLISSCTCFENVNLWKKNPDISKLYSDSDLVKQAGLNVHLKNPTYQVCDAPNKLCRQEHTVFMLVPLLQTQDGISGDI